MRKLLIFVVLALATSLLTNSLNAQTSDDALKALKKIDATVAMGVNFPDYTRLMGESNYAMQEYLSKPTQNKPLDKAIRNAWDLYVLAKKAWTNIKGEPARYRWREGRGGDPSLYDALMKISGMNKAIIDRGGSIAVELALPLIWSDASKKVRLASQLAEISKD